MCARTHQRMHTCVSLGCKGHLPLSPVVGGGGALTAGGGGVATAGGGGATTAGGGRECDRVEEASFWMRFC